MLDTDTKRRIDTARDILVGKVPDPKSQVEQITIALIYKFMDDMDAESEEMGGKRKFFAGEFARYGWAKLMHSGLGGHETLNLYAEAIAKMPENPGIPLLFREIFKNAYLPYRDPETLRAFLKVIDEFNYDHSERLGDAFEYLLSVLGSQGDAGQFRTPRHIIDFIVAVIDPKKNESVLDPACGTAGFLISSYKHILKANTDAKGHSTLTPDDKGRLAQNFKGYDISPDMVRLSLVNLYLHGFADPHIIEYDTLTSLDRWNEYADVILANPPFMSPKGGIKPHNRFSIQAKRSEVLFVDYMAEHLTPNGRAGIIVPEGVIFQSQSAYTQLRKMLVEEYLVAVVSMPAGMFNPYSGVKTSILILDKSLAKASDTIAFFKVENDGFGLGAQRREIEKNDLPQTRTEIGEYLRHLRAGESVEDFQPAHGLIVPKEKIAANGDYNLSGERYREVGTRAIKWPMVELGEICDFLRGPFGSSIKRSVCVDKGKDTYKVYEQGNVINNDFIRGKYYLSKEQFSELKKFEIAEGDILITCAGTLGRIAVVPKGIERGIINSVLMRVRIKKNDVNQNYLVYLLESENIQRRIGDKATGVALKNMFATSELRRFEIPLPPLDVQNELVDEIKGYQKVINGARAVLDHYRPHIPIHPDWPMVTIDDVCSTSSGGTPLSGNAAYYEGGAIPWLRSGEVAQGEVFHSELFITEEGLRNSSAKMFPINTVLVAMYGATAGEVGILRFEASTNQAVCGITPDQRLSPDFLYLVLKADKPALIRLAGGGAQPNISQKIIREFKIPLPPLEAQQAIVAEIETEQALVAANRELIARFEKKIQSTLARVWGDDESAPAEA
ncbi:MAG: N-6 DNA methylase [Gammaproteobacteria bacterium]